MYQAFLEEFDNHTPPGYLLTNAGCLGPCAVGPNVLVYPDGILYTHVTPADVKEIVQQHLVAGRPVARLVSEDVVE